MYVTMSVDIEAPPEKVWPYLVEPEKCMQWFTALKIFKYTSEEQGGVGARPVYCSNPHPVLRSRGIFSFASMNCRWVNFRFKAMRRIPSVSGVETRPSPSATAKSTSRN
jgi:hypothetical protein